MELSKDKGNKFVEDTQSPEGAAAWKKQLDEFAPGSSDWVVEAVFGGTYQREGIELRDRQMLNMAALATQQTPTSIRMTVSVIVVLPILFVYPMFQRFFVKGIMIGSVKG